MTKKERLSALEKRVGILEKRLLELERGEAQGVPEKLCEGRVHAMRFCFPQNPYADPGGVPSEQHYKA